MPLHKIVNETFTVKVNTRCSSKCALAYLGLPYQAIRMAVVQLAHNADHSGSYLARICVASVHNLLE